MGGIFHGRGVAATIAIAVGCTSACSGSSARADAAPDPASIDCLVAEVDADIGTCVNRANGGDCYLSPPESPALVALDDGQTLDMFRGPQGADMFVMGLRTTDLIPGGIDLDHPRVTIAIHRDSERVANYEASIVFSPDADAETVSALGLFVVLSGPGTELTGQTVNAVARIADREQNVRCGRVSLVAGQVARLP